MPDAKDQLWNCFTDGIRDAVRVAMQDPDKLITVPRIYDDLLSSQPLCFNLFGELRLDLSLATRVLRRMHLAIARVTRIEFEHSPGRASPRYTDDHSAFDVYIEYARAVGGNGFLGIEVKYVEGMDDKLALHRERYDEVVALMGAFHPDQLGRLRAKPINQLWRDHLLAGQHAS